MSWRALLLPPLSASHEADRLACTTGRRRLDAQLALRRIIRSLTERPPFSLSSRPASPPKPFSRPQSTRLDARSAPPVDAWDERRHHAQAGSGNGSDGRGGCCGATDERGPSSRREGQAAGRASRQGCADTVRSLSRRGIAPVGEEAALLYNYSSEDAQTSTTETVSP